MAASTKHLHRVRIPYFRIWYSSTFTALFAGTCILLAATPADLIFQSIRNHQIPNVAIVGGVTLATALIVALVYSTRLYTNRSVLVAIPKNFIPIGPGEVGKNVRKLILRELHRSALVAWDSRPRDTRNELSSSVGGNLERWDTEHLHQTARRHSRIHDAIVIPISTSRPPWGPIGHAGWSSPASDDLPDLQFESVFKELPNLIEAKAVSLAPADPGFAAAMAKNPELPPVPDERVVELLRRPQGLAMREYIGRLSRLHLINPPSVGAEFLRRYEFARFSTQPLSEAQFRALMDAFGNVLAGMTDIDPAILVSILKSSSASTSASSSIAPPSSSAASARSTVPASSASGSVRRYETPRPSSGMRSASMVTAHSGPLRTMQASERQRMLSGLSQVSTDSFARTRQELDDDDGDAASLASRPPSMLSDQSVVRHYSTGPD